ncbi:hypothetical protein OG21DRAFT_1501360 [Imleria badia]|nr:hypothetical protein OG21DRAFT_1501360 [Imleria badia]
MPHFSHHRPSHSSPRTSPRKATPQWTCSSLQLQEIVSKAIRLSAREFFVRLLSPQALEVDLVHEADRLNAAIVEAQAKWRFEHQHWASALGMGLRKLNKAHERQGQELKRVQARVQTLEDEHEEAWREFGGLEHETAESDSEVVESPQEDIPDPRPGLDLKHDRDETGTPGDVTIDTRPRRHSHRSRLQGHPRHLSQTSRRQVRHQVIRSTRDGQSHLSRISSARMRSRAASNASLRLPKTLRSAPSTQSSPVDVFPPKPHPEPTLSLPTPPLPTHAVAHFHGPLLSSSSHSMGIVSAGVGRPGSAGARLTTPRESERGTPLPTATPRKSLVSRASSVILRRLSQATTMGGHRVRTVSGRGGVGSPSRTTRLNGRERWKDRAREDVGIGEVEGEGEMMLIGSPHAEVLDTDTP